MGVGILLLLGPLARPSSAATAAPALDTTFSTLLNTLRTSLGLGTLSLDTELSGIARSWSVQMANSGTLSHNGALTSQATGWAKLGENVGTGGAVTQIFNALVASPPHMRNMSDGQFTRIGVGTVTDGQGRLWTTHVFMRPKTAGAVSAPAPTAAPVTKAPAPVTTRAPKPAPTTAAPTTVAPAPPVTAAPATVPAPVPVPTTTPVIEAANAEPTEATIPVTSAAMEPASATPAGGEGIPPVVIAGWALLVLLVLCSGGFLLRRTAGRSVQPTLPTSFAVAARSTPASAWPVEQRTEERELICS
jgi:hypothetical protein